jgi:ABC-type branched-subunit amino acid transport system substrate-binding protein
MTGSRGLHRLIAALAIAAALGSCALFQPERLAVRTQVSETMPGVAVTQAPGVAPTPTSGARVVFQPGSAGRAGSKANYASDDGVTAGEIRIGTVQPFDGPAAALGRPLYNTTQAYVNWINSRGGINGRRVRLFLQTACINCEKENRIAVKALVEEKKVFAIVNTYMNTYAFGAALKYLNDKKVPLIQGWSGVGADRAVWGAGQTAWNVYYTMRNEVAVHVYAAWLDKVMRSWMSAGRIPQGDFSAGTVSLDVPQDNRRAAEFEKAWKRYGTDHRVTRKERVAAEEESVTRMDSVVSAIQRSGAQAVFSASNITMVFGMQAASRQSWHVPWVAKSAWGRAATDNCGAACNGGYTDNNGWGWPGVNTPQMRQYKDVMARYYPDSTDDAQTLGGWIGMMAFEYGAGGLGADLKRGPLMDILTNLQSFDTGIGAVIDTRDTARLGERDAAADHLGMGQFMMLQICDNRFWRVTDWMGRGSKPRMLSNSGSRCGWGYP